MKTDRGTVDHRKEPRHSVTWRGRLTLPNGEVTEVRVRDISDQGVGLLCERPVPGHTILSLLLGVPDLGDLSRIMAVPVEIDTAYVVMQGHDFRVGGLWVELTPPVRELIQAWIRKLSFAA